MTIYEQELYHHGILGQKWGVRRFQNVDGSLTSAGRNRYGVVDAKTVGTAKDVKTVSKSDGYLPHAETESKKKLISKIKEAGQLLDTLEENEYVKITKDANKMQQKAIDTYGGLVSVWKDYNNNNAAQSWTDYMSKLEHDANGNLTKEARDDIINSCIVDAALTNPGYTYGLTNMERAVNCLLCSATLEMRGRGYDVYAGDNYGTNLYKNVANYDYGNIKDSWYKKTGLDKGTYAIAIPNVFNVTDNRVSKFKKEISHNAATDSNIKKISNYLSSQGVGASGIIGITYAEGGGHAVHYKVIGPPPEVIIMDGQNAVVFTDLTAFAHAYNANTIGTCRLDDLEINTEGNNVIDFAYNSKPKSKPDAIPSHDENMSRRNYAAVSTVKPKDIIDKNKSTETSVIKNAATDIGRFYKKAAKTAVSKLKGLFS